MGLNSTVTPLLKTTVTIAEQILPLKGAAEEEHHSSMAIFFVLSVIGMICEKNNHL